MKSKEIAAYLGEHFPQSVLYTDNEEIYTVATFEDAEPGDISWLLPERVDRVHEFKGSMLLNDRLAMMKVIEKFFPTDDDLPAGFTFEWDGERYMRWPHLGGIIIEDDVEIGQYVTIDRGSISSTIIHRGVRIDHHVHIAHNCEIGKHSIIVAGSVICGSVTLGKNVYVGANATIKHRLSIGDNAIIGMGAVVTKDVPADECWVGNPARFYGRSDEVSRP